MNRKLFRYLSYLLFLFPVPCFVASVSTISATENVAREEQIKAFFEKIINAELDKDFEKLKKNYIELFKLKNSKKNDGNTPFTYAARNGKLEALKKLKEWGEDVNATDAYKNNALYLACLHSDEVPVVEWLLECGIGVETKGQDKATPFLNAARRGTIEVAELLKKKGANINARDGKNRNALHLACYFSGEVLVVEWLLDVCKIDIESKGEAQRTPFLTAIEGSDFEVAKLLKERGANTNAKDKPGDNALHLACLSGDIEMTTWLLDVCKIKIESKGEDERTPFLSAAEGGNFDVAKLLKKRSVNLNAKDQHGDNALHYACLESRSEDMVTWLLDKEPSGCGLDIESKGKDKRTPFLCAAEGGDVDIAELLKERGATLNEEDEHGDNALHYACLGSNNGDMVTWLLDKKNECGLDIESKGKDQRTPFLCAAEKGQLDVAKLLKKRGVNLNAKNEYGDNALHYACLGSSSEEMVTWLLDECRIDIESKGKDQRTPFLCAAEAGDLDMVKLLEKKGANIYAKDKDGNTALHLANDSQVRNHLYLILVKSLAPWFFLVLVISTLLFLALSNAKDKRMLKNRRISRNKKSSKKKRSSRASHRRQQSR